MTESERQNEGKSNDKLSSESDDQQMMTANDDDDDVLLNQNTDFEASPPKRNRKKRRNPTLPIQRWHLFIAHIAICAVYLLPILNVPKLDFHSGLPVLDELHIASNPDVHNDNVIDDESTTIANIWTKILTNDYWGRPMSKEDSHRSWRPLSILSFRLLKGNTKNPESVILTTHRVVNVVLHAAVAECLGVLSTRFVHKPYHYTLVHLVTKLWFGLHPTHVEVTANAANRPHLLALLGCVVASDPNVSWITFILCLVGGYLSCETFLFQTVPIAGTLCVVAYHRLYCGNRKRSFNGGNNDGDHWLIQCFMVLREVYVRLALVVLSGVGYYVGRWYMGWLDIPEGLIRPAENPFFKFMGWHRVRNYLFILAVHTLKAWDFDIIGFSHEYGFDCIPELTSWTDPRLLWPTGIFTAYLSTLMTALILLVRRKRLSPLLLWWALQVAYMVTLFPVSGFVKVGTFVSDRIVVAASASTSLIMANLACRWITWRRKDSTSQRRKLALVLVLFALMGRRVYIRSCDWMDSFSLMKSALVTCPRFAKAHLEISKIYSGLYPHMKDLNEARERIATAERIDPDFCDVHQQYAHVALQQGSMLEFEKSLSKSVLCPFSASGAQDQWNKYWTMTLKGNQSPPQQVERAYKRYKDYMVTINAEIKRRTA